MNTQANIPKEITAEISARYNIGHYGLNGMFIHCNYGKVLKTFTSATSDYDNWLEAVTWGAANFHRIQKH